MLLVHGPRSTTYDFGPGHPLTPRRFGPGIDLLRAVGAEPALAPQPAPDAELLWCHTQHYIDIVRSFSADPFGMPAAGIAEGGDVPPFAGMHDASAAVAGGSLRAVEAILRGDVEHAFHPGGGLHHAMPDRASGFCVYDDPALAIARARHDGLRVLYLDFDVHHGDGVQAIHAADPGVLTLSFHETGRYLFPGTGEVDELGEGVAAGTSLNVPFQPGTGEGAWLGAIRSSVPEVAAAFGPDLIVSQHGADSHAFDPLAHLRVTTTAMGEVARLVDALAHRYAGGRWLATGGGGYDVYRVVPRMWSLVWLAGAHREVPDATPVAWRDRWAADGARYGQTPLPERFVDLPNAGLLLDASQMAAETHSTETAGLVRKVAVPALLREARDRGWWDPLAEASTGSHASPARAGEPADTATSPTIVADIDVLTWDSLFLAPGVIAPASAADGHALVAAGLRDGLRATVAMAGTTVVGAAVSRGESGSGRADLLALGVAPGWRRRRLAGAILAAHADAVASDTDLNTVVNVAERDPIDPLDGGLRRDIARRLLTAAGFEIVPAMAPIRAADPAAFGALLRRRRGAA